MAMSFNLFTDDFDGLQLELFDGSGPIPLFVGAQPITGGIARFTQAAFNGHAVRLRSGDAPWLRSGARDLTISRDDSGAREALITGLDIALVGDVLSASGTAVSLKTAGGHQGDRSRGEFVRREAGRQGSGGEREIWVVITIYNNRPSAVGRKDRRSRNPHARGKPPDHHFRARSTLRRGRPSAVGGRSKLTGYATA